MVTVALILLLAALAIGKPWNVATFTIGKQTENGESVQLVTNFPFWAGKAGREKRAQAVAEVADFRLKYNHERLQAQIAEEEAKQVKEVNEKKRA